MQDGPVREQEASKRLGSGMTIAAWIVVLLLATLYFDHFLERQKNPNQEVRATVADGARQITLQRNRQGHYLASGKINGAPVSFLLDTGATDVSVPRRIAERLNLQRGPEIRVSTANGTIPVHVTLLQRVEIGNIALDNVRASINPFMQEKEVLLGMSFLKHLEFTQRGNELILRQYN